MAVRTGLIAAMTAALALAACGGGSGSSGGTGGGSGGSLDVDTNPGTVVGASPLFNSSIENEFAIARSVRGTPLDVLPTFVGSASYSGFGSIFDSSLTDDDDTIARRQGRMVVTNVEATINFGDRTINVTQDRFIDVVGNSVPGEVNWIGTYSGNERGVFVAQASGDVGGTAFDTSPNRAGVSFRGDQNKGTIVGVFLNAPISNPGTGWLKGTTVTGDFAATTP